MLAPALTGAFIPGLWALGMVGMAWFKKGHQLDNTPAADDPTDELPPSPEAVRHLDRELTELARGLSHDVAGPLRTLDSALRLVEADIERGRTQRSKATLAAVRKQARHLSGVSTALVAYCRSAWKEYPVQTTSLAVLVGRLVAELANTDGPAVRVQVPGLRVTAETDALKRALRELLHNAMIHHDKGTDGQITIRARVEEAGLGATPTRPSVLHIHVDDNGPGIAQDMHEAVFDFFRRAATQAEGAGLGLSLSRTLAERFGGRVSLQSARPRGTSAHLSWPVEVPAAASGSPA